MMYETSNRMEGIPFADSFTVESKWRITEEVSSVRVLVPYVGPLFVLVCG